MSNETSLFPSDNEQNDIIIYRSKDGKVNVALMTRDGKDKMIYYSLEMILAIGYRVRGVRGVQFRQWATQHLSEYLVKGFTMDDERLKNPDGRPDYFDELLERIRDIRASEKRFYQKLRDLFRLFPRSSRSRWKRACFQWRNGSLCQGNLQSFQ